MQRVMAITVFAVFGLVSPGKLWSEEIICPASIETKVIADDVKGWQVTQPSPKTHPLLTVNFTDSDSMGILHEDEDLDEEGRQVGEDEAVKYRWRLAKEGDYYAVCSYKESSISLEKPLPKGLITCEVNDKKDKYGKLSFNGAHCN